MLKGLSVSELCEGTLEEEAFKVPREIGCYSVDAQKELHYDRSQMKYYLPRENKDLHLDLNVGYEDTLREPYNSLKNFHSFLKVIADSHFDVLDSVDFVTSRGTIQKLLHTPFSSGDHADPWVIIARRFDDVIYLTQIDTDAKLEREKNATEEDKRMAAWGFRFEAYMTADRPNGVPDTASITHEIEKYKIVFTNKIGSYDLLMSAETDGVNPSKSSRLRNGDPSCYIELKTSKISPDFRSTYSFKRYKSLQWWAQSVIVGIEDTICGLRDDEGIVRFIANFKTKELPFLCLDFWNPEVCFNFCNNFLKYLTSRVTNPRIVYKFEYNGRRKVIGFTFRDPIERFQVIPEWYLAKLRQHKRRKKI